VSRCSARIFLAGESLMLRVIFEARKQAAARSSNARDTCAMVANRIAMPDREIFKARLFCPNCRTTGQAIVEDEENPARSDAKRDRLVLAVSQGFAGGSHLDGVQQVICVNCRGPIPI
jgi:hypothetical protein